MIRALCSSDKLRTVHVWIFNGVYQSCVDQSLQTLCSEGTTLLSSDLIPKACLCHLYANNCIQLLSGVLPNFTLY